MPDRPPRGHRDRGLTLVELLISVVITGIIISSIGGGIVVVMKTADPTAKRLAATTDEQNLVTWLPVDVSSTPSSNVWTDPDFPSGCAGESPGINLLKLKWTETVNGTTTTYRAAYRAVPTAAGIRVQRFVCSGVASMSVATVSNVSGELAPLPLDWTPGEAPVAVVADGATVSFVVTQPDGRRISVEAAHKNPAATLPPGPSSTSSTSSTSTTSTTTTSTTTTTTTVDPSEPTTTVDPSGTTTTSSTSTSTSSTTTTVPCVVASMTLSTTTAPTHSKAPNKLQDDVTVTITTSGPCPQLRLEYETQGSQGLLYQNFPLTSPATVTLRGFKTGGAEIWTAGPHTLNVIDNSNVVLATAVLQVT